MVIPCEKLKDQTMVARFTPSETPRQFLWACGLTTVPSRRVSLLPRTLIALRDAGFKDIRVFVDGPDNGEYRDIGLPTTFRDNVGIYGNWALGLHELFIRNPKANRFVMFQDDFTCYRNLREYLERVPYPAKGYLNLYTAFKSNEPVIKGKPVGWCEASTLNPGSPWQTGRGAVALVFDVEAVVALLSSRSWIMKPRAADKKVALQRVDGGIVTALNTAGLREYIHNPSLVQHTGDKSTWRAMPHPHAESYRGDNFNCLDLLKEWVQ